jgi:hypothetical protein
VLNKFYPMKWRLSLCLVMLFLLLPFFTYAQTSHDSISVYRTIWGDQFYQNNQRIPLSQVYRMMHPNRTAYHLFKASKGNRFYASLLSGIGGFALGFELGNLLNNGEAHRAVALVGAGLVFGSIPLYRNSNRQLISSLEEYHGGLKKTSLLQIQEMKWLVGLNGIGLRIGF